MKYRIFISSVQSEFAKERKALAKYIREDALLGDFFVEGPSRGAQSWPSQMAQSGPSRGAESGGRVKGAESQGLVRG